MLKPSLTASSGTLTNIHIKGIELFAESAHSDLYAAVDELVDKLNRQVVRHKGRLQSHHHDAPKRLM